MSEDRKKSVKYLIMRKLKCTKYMYYFNNSYNNNRFRLFASNKYGFLSLEFTRMLREKNCFVSREGHFGQQNLWFVRQTVGKQNALRVRKNIEQMLLIPSAYSFLIPDDCVFKWIVIVSPRDHQRLKYKFHYDIHNLNYFIGTTIVGKGKYFGSHTIHVLD